MTEAGIKAITPGDCKFLSATIAAKVHKQISDTTFKRIYGFTYSKFLPSLYTLNILSAYCGYASWEEFCSHSDTEAEVSDVVKITDQALTTATHVQRHTQKTLQTLNNRSVIPYHFTIKRDFVDEHLEIFSQGSETATLLTAPAGYGKTVALCHWVEKKLDAIAAGKSKDIILFLSGKVLPGHPHNASISDWLKALLGINSENGLGLLVDNQQLESSKFYFIIDAFDREIFRGGEFEQFCDLLIDLLALYQNLSGFKLILSMRSAGWIHLRNRLLIESNINIWFKGFMQTEQEDTNMLLFSAQEIQSLCKKINPADEYGSKLMSPEMISLFSYPLFFQYYYKKHPLNFNVARLDYYDIYDIVSSYFMDKIYTARFSTEKVHIIRILLNNGAFYGESFMVDKLVVFEALKPYREAYDDMMSLGFIREINYSSDGRYANYVEFTHQRLLSYCFARLMVYENNEKYDEALMHMLCKRLDEGHRVTVLKWCIFSAVKAKQFDIFRHMTLVTLNSAEKAKLIKFLVQLIQHSSFPVNGINLILYSFGDKQDLFHYFFGIEFISPEYEEALQGLLSLKLDDSSKVWVYTCLAIIGMAQLNSTAIEKYVKALREFPESAYTKFEINPLYCIESIYYYWKYGVIRKDALLQITRFCFKNSDRKTENKYSLNQVLYLLALTALHTANNKRKVVRYITTVERVITSKEQSCPTLQFFLMITKSDAYLELDNIDAGLQVYDGVMADYAMNKRKYTPYMRICLNMLTVKILTLTGRYDEVPDVMTRIAHVSGTYKFNYIEVYTLVGYLSGQHNTADEFYRDNYFKFIKLVRNSGFEPQRFLPNYAELSAMVMSS